MNEYKSGVGILVSILLLLIGTSISAVVFAQNSTAQPVPTWTSFSTAENQINPTPTFDYAHASRHEMFQEQERVMREHRAKGLATPLPHSKDFVPNSQKPLPPTNFKIKSGDGVAYFSWGKGAGAGAYLIYVSKDGKKYKPTSKVQVKGLKTIIGALENGKTYYYGITSVAPSGEESNMIFETVTPKSIKSK